jgi:hypothetical protein
MPPPPPRVCLREPSPPVEADATADQGARGVIDLSWEHPRPAPAAVAPVDGAAAARVVPPTARLLRRLGDALHPWVAKFGQAELQAQLHAPLPPPPAARGSGMDVSLDRLRQVLSGCLATCLVADGNQRACCRFGVAPVELSLALLSAFIGHVVGDVVPADGRRRAACKMLLPPLEPVVLAARFLRRKVEDMQRGAARRPHAAHGRVPAAAASDACPWSTWFNSLLYQVDAALLAERS